MLSSSKQGSKTDVGYKVGRTKLANLLSNSKGSTRKRRKEREERTKKRKKKAQAKESQSGFIAHQKKAKESTSLGAPSSARLVASCECRLFESAVHTPDWHRHPTKARLGKPCTLLVGADDPTLPNGPGT